MEFQKNIYSILIIIIQLFLLHLKIKNRMDYYKATLINGNSRCHQITAAIYYISIIFFLQIQILTS